MTNSPESLSRLTVRVAVFDGRHAVLVSIDGVDILELQRPVHRPDGSPYPHGPKMFIPPVPIVLLPPDSAVLLPTVAPKHAMIGICDCGDPGDSSLWVRVWRSGKEVIWEPDPDTPRSSVDTAWRFDLYEYLEAIDDGYQSAQGLETRARQFARELRQRRDSLFGFLMIDARTGERMRLIDAKAMTGDEILMTVATPTGVRELRVTVSIDRSNAQILDSLFQIDMERFE